MSQTLPKDDVFRENQEHSCTTLTLDSSRERGGPEFNEKRIRTRHFYGDDHEGVSLRNIERTFDDFVMG